MFNTWFECYVFCKTKYGNDGENLNIYYFKGVYKILQNSEF